MIADLRRCKKCRTTFSHRGGVGRPPSYCPACREGRRSDDSDWRTIRARVLLEESVCAVLGCNRPSTTVDHVIPLSKGGARLARENLRGMCGPHNFSKGDRLLVPRAMKPTDTRPPFVCKCRFPMPDARRHWCMP